jgi:hypothetical protein
MSVALLTPDETTVTNAPVYEYYLMDKLPTYFMGSVLHFLHNVIIVYFKECLNTPDCNMKTVMYKLLFFQSEAS